MPYGYRRGPTGLVEVDPEPAADVVRIFELVRGGLSIRKVATEVGMRPVVDRIVCREVHAGARRAAA